MRRTGEAGQGTGVHLVYEEATEPYHRPPLSKSFLKVAGETAQSHRGADRYRRAGLTLRLGAAAMTIERVARNITLRSGASCQGSNW